MVYLTARRNVIIEKRRISLFDFVYSFVRRSDKSIRMQMSTGAKPLANLAQTIDPEANENRRRAGMSKYDFFPVKVITGESDSYFILSRLIILRMFCVIGVSSSLRIDRPFSSRSHREGYQEEHLEQQED